MDQLRSAGHAVGEYVGGGRAEMEDESTEQTDDHRPESMESGVEMDVDDSLEDVDNLYIPSSFSV